MYRSHFSKIRLINRANYRRSKSKRAAPPDEGNVSTLPAKSLPKISQGKAENGKMPIGAHPIEQNEHSHLESWLSKLDMCGDQLTPTIEADDAEVLPRSLNNSPPALDSDADLDEPAILGGTNPFLHALSISDEQPAADQDELQLSPDTRVKNFTFKIESRKAVPTYALSDAVFCVDMPNHAVLLGTELPVRPLAENYKVGVTIKLIVSSIYSPFQFWFHDTSEEVTSLTVPQIARDLYNFFCDVSISDWQLPTYFVQPGYLCVVRHELVWKRAQIFCEPIAYEEQVTIYLVDYGKDVLLPQSHLYFMHCQFAQIPALVRRGTLTDVYPLYLHWPPEATHKFAELVNNCELYALIKDIDVKQRTLFVSLSAKRNFLSTISEQLIYARLAGRSHNYSDECRKAHGGRRVRYIRERLPTFDMLETHVFPEWLNNFEEQFDRIIYTPSFYQEFCPSKLSNPFLGKLQDALNSWQIQFKAEELAWRESLKDDPQPCEQPQIE